MSAFHEIWEYDKICINFWTHSVCIISFKNTFCKTMTSSRERFLWTLFSFLTATSTGLFFRIPALQRFLSSCAPRVAAGRRPTQIGTEEVEFKHASMRLVFFRARARALPAEKVECSICFHFPQARRRFLWMLFFFRAYSADIIYTFNDLNIPHLFCVLVRFSFFIVTL